MSQGRIDDALGLYGDVLKIDPNNVLALGDRGTVYAMAKRFDLAANDLGRAFALGSREAANYCTMATVCFELNRFPESLDYFAKAVAQDPNYPFIYNNRAGLHEAMGNKAAAIADLEKCLQFNPDEKLKQRLLERIGRLTSNEPQAPVAAERDRLSVSGGEKCPRSGYWLTPAKENSRRFFNVGEVMPKLGGDYGATIWQLAESQ